MIIVGTVGAAAAFGFGKVNTYDSFGAVVGRIIRVLGGVGIAGIGSIGLAAKMSATSHQYEIATNGDKLVSLVVDDQTSAKELKVKSMGSLSQAVDEIRADAIGME